MTSSQVQVSETPPMSQQDLESLKDENGLYAGKFKTVEDLANSYKELEGKLGSVTEEDQVSESTEETTGVPEGYEDYYQEDGTVDYNSVNENYGEILGEIFKENSIDPYKIAAEFDKNEGEIPEEMYQSLLDAGLSANAVDSYLKGVAVERGFVEGEEGAAEELAQEEVKGIRDSIGGDEAYEQLVQWSSKNLPEETLKSFDELLNTATVPVIKMAVAGLKAQMDQAQGYEPDLIGGRSPRSDNNPFQTPAEIAAAMSDPRYGKDAAYTQMVYARVGSSDAV